MFNHVLRPYEQLWTLVQCFLEAFYRKRTLEFHFVISVAVLWVSFVLRVSR